MNAIRKRRRRERRQETVAQGSGFQVFLIVGLDGLYRPAMQALSRHRPQQYDAV